VSAPVLYLVDAHNIIYQDPALRRFAARPEAARAELEALLDGQANLLLFYDGGPGGRAHTAYRRSLRIDYSGREEADDRIIAWLREHPGKRTILVSDDRALRARAAALGAKLAPARGFLDRFRVRPGRGAMKPETPTDPELRMWMELFGEK
jgi:hypothetical protein